MQLGSNRVWDYTADNYVHRLIQNKTDGKLVQFDESGRVVILFFYVFIILRVPVKMSLFNFFKINQDEKIDWFNMDVREFYFICFISKNGAE